MKLRWRKRKHEGRRLVGDCITYELVEGNVVRICVSGIDRRGWYWYTLYRPDNVPLVNTSHVPVKTADDAKRQAKEWYENAVKTSN